MATLSVRPMTAADIPSVVAYWRDATPEDLARMGVDPSKLPPPDRMEAALRRSFEEPADPAPTAFVLVWEVDGRGVGFVTARNVVRGASAEMHLHMWDVALRGKGHGARLFCMAALDLYERFALERIVCEPRAANPMPNGMLRKVGFPLETTYVGASSPLSATCELNRYVIERSVAERYLRAP